MTSIHAVVTIWILCGFVSSFILYWRTGMFSIKSYWGPADVMISWFLIFICGPIGGIPVMLWIMYMFWKYYGD